MVIPVSQEQFGCELFALRVAAYKHTRPTTAGSIRTYTDTTAAQRFN